MFATDDNQVAYVSNGSYGNWTFYKSPDPHKKKGKRIKARSCQLWYKTKDAAAVGLAGYAQMRGWKPMNAEF